MKYSVFNLKNSIVDTFYIRIYYWNEDFKISVIDGNQTQALLSGTRCLNHRGTGTQLLNIHSWYNLFVPISYTTSIDVRKNLLRREIQTMKWNMEITNILVIKQWHWIKTCYSNMSRNYSYYWNEYWKHSVADGNRTRVPRQWLYG